MTATVLMQIPDDVARALPGFALVEKQARLAFWRRHIENAITANDLVDAAPTANGVRVGDRVVTDESYMKARSAAKAMLPPPEETDPGSLTAEIVSVEGEAEVRWVFMKVIEGEEYFHKVVKGLASWPAGVEALRQSGIEVNA